MFLILGGISIELISQDAAILDEWRKQFGDFIVPFASPIDLQLTAHLVEQLPPLPTSQPVYIDQRPDADGNQASILQAFRSDSQLTLHFFRGGLVAVPLQASSLPTIEAWLTAESLENGLIEDATLVALQPLLRRLGCFFIHASGVSLQEQAVLFVGGSGSGKTTTCLNLVLNGWHMLANDVVLVKQLADGVYAYPVPDNVTIRPKTRALLPQLHPYTRATQSEQSFPAQKLVQGNWSEPARISTLCFPQVSALATTAVEPQMQSIALALLMQESIDRWDEPAMRGHSDILNTICQQAACYQLSLGDDLDDQQAVIKALLQ